MINKSVRLSSKKKQSGSVEESTVLSVKCTFDNNIDKVIYGEELDQYGRRKKTPQKLSEKKRAALGENSSAELKKIDEQKSGKTPRSQKKEDLKRAIQNAIGIDINEELNKMKCNQNTPISVKKRGRTKKFVEESGNDEEENTDEKELCEKPSGLCDDDDVAGNEMCSFRTPKKKQGMYQKALESAGKNSNSGTPNSKLRTPSRNVTPNSTSRLNHVVTPRKRTSTVKRTPSLVPTPKRSTPLRNNESKSVTLPAVTPYNLRAKHKRAIQTHMKHLTAVDDSEDSDYRGSDDSSSESEESDSSQEKGDSSSDSGKGSEELKPLCRRSLRFQNLKYTKKKCKDSNYVFTTDEYFESQGGKSKTSDRKLSQLQTPRLDNSALQDLLSSCSITHPQILAERRSDDIAMFERWMFALSQGFSVLAYGLGSKYKILQNFHREMLSESHVLVVNGFFPSLTIKEVVEMIARDLLGLKQVLPSSHAIIDWIENRRHMPRVFLIVHNIDAEPLRNDKTQHILSRLASLPKVHLVASVDHINCPLLWDQAKLSGFNFMWEDATSFLPFQEETSYETSLMVQKSGSLALSSLLNVYRSLTHNSRGVFRVILEKHLEENNQKYNGMAFSSLYKKCRDEMLVTNDLTLRTMLTEFLDHQMVKWRRDAEHLFIPVETGILQQFHKIIKDS